MRCSPCRSRFDLVDDNQEVFCTCPKDQLPRAEVIDIEYLNPYEFLSHLDQTRSINPGEQLLEDALALLNTTTIWTTGSSL
jgi:hypothetical protein